LSGKGPEILLVVRENFVYPSVVRLLCLFNVSAQKIDCCNEQKLQKGKKYKIGNAHIFSACTELNGDGKESVLGRKS